MGRRELEEIILRARDDEGFRLRLIKDPRGVFEEYKLSEQEIIALQSGDTSLLIKLGVRPELAASPPEVI